MKATVITVYDNDGNEIKNVSTEIVLNGETYVKREIGKASTPDALTKPIWETCRDTMWKYDSTVYITTFDGYDSYLEQDESLIELTKHLNALAYLSEVARRCNGERVVDWGNEDQKKYYVRRYKNILETGWTEVYHKEITFLDEVARDHSFEVDKHIWNDYYGLPNE